MEYIYIVLILQELGKEINEINIQKVLEALEVEVDDNKIQLMILALDMFSSRNTQKKRKSDKMDVLEKLANLENKFEVVQSSIKKADKKINKFNKEQALDSENKIHEEAKNPIEVEHIEVVDDKITTHESILEDEVTDEKSALYVYGIGDSREQGSFGEIGLDKAEVYTIPYRDMCIAVHKCLPEPYQSDDNEVVKNWLFTQQEVLDAIWERFEVVLPMGFDMIIEGRSGRSSREELKVWIDENYGDFHQKIIKLKNKREYGVQVMIDTENLSTKLLETNEELIRKKKEIDAMPQGIAYMEREQLKDLIKEKIEETADLYFKEFYSMVKECTEDIVIGKTKKVEGNKQMIMNLSCLVNKDKVVRLGEELEEMEHKDGVSVRFSGPWAPFSFVTPEKRGEE